MLLKNIQLVVSRLFAGDNRLSPDILLVTTGCHQTKNSRDNRLSADLTLCKSLFEFLLLGFLFGNNSSTLLFLLWKSCMIKEMLNVRLTDLDQEDIIIYKKIN